MPPGNRAPRLDLARRSARLKGAREAATERCEALGRLSLLCLILRDGPTTRYFDFRKEQWLIRIKT